VTTRFRIWVGVARRALVVGIAPLGGVGGGRGKFGGTEKGRRGVGLCGGGGGSCGGRLLGDALKAVDPFYNFFRPLYCIHGIQQIQGRQTEVTDGDSVGVERAVDVGERTKVVEKIGYCPPFVK
jgi:hypothetical protein